MRGFDHIETWVFDLDNTLYPASCRLFDQIDRKMTGLVSEILTIAPTEARTIQKGLFHKSGTTGRLSLHCSLSAKTSRLSTHCWRCSRTVGRPPTSCSGCFRRSVSHRPKTPYPEPGVTSDSATASS